ncbi:MAG: hypothetical protein GY835_25785 [bacterium]|nr:hypothetical protein [bacterium]
MVKNHQAYCLTPESDAYRVVCLKPTSGEFDFLVEWDDTLSVSSTRQGKRWREMIAQEKRTTLLMASDKASLNQMRLPNLKVKERTNAILGMMRKQRGQNDRNWYIDFCEVIHPDGDVQSDPRKVFTILSTEEEFLNNQLLHLAGSGLRPTRAIPKPLALEALMRKHHPELLEAKGAWNLVYLGESENFLIIGDRSGPILIRSLSEDLSDGADPDEYLQRLATEVERSNFFARQGEVSTEVTSIIVTGEPGLADSMLTLLDKSENFELIRWLPEERFSYDGAAASWRQVTMLAGAVMQYESYNLNLIPVRREDTVAWKLRHYSLLGTATATLWLLPLILAGSWLTGDIQDRIATQQSVQLSHSREQARASAYNYLGNLNLLTRNDFLTELGPGRGNLAGFLRDLSQRTPDSVRLTNLVVERTVRGYTVTIDGDCRTGSSRDAQNQFLKLKEALRNSPLLCKDDEPIFLEITGEEKVSTKQSIVTFKLAYSISKELSG